MAEIFEQRSRQPGHDPQERARLAAEAVRYREMAKIEEEALQVINEPPAPSA